MDTETGDVLLDPVEPHASWVTTVAVSPCSALIASGSQYNWIVILSADTGEGVAGFIGHTGAVNSVAFSLDGSRIASASNDLSIRIWDVITGDLLHSPFLGHKNYTMRGLLAR